MEPIIKQYIKAIIDTQREILNMLLHDEHMDSDLVLEISRELDELINRYNSLD